MFDKFDTAVKDYLTKWQEFMLQRSKQEFFRKLKPVAIGWKVADRNEYDDIYHELHEACDKIVETYMNGRWIAKLHLKDARLSGGIEIIKLMQRRPGSADAVGLDHIDFYSPEVSRAPEILESERNLKWTEESNDGAENYTWISVWFADTEAKLKASTVLDIVTQELQQINRSITA